MRLTVLGNNGPFPAPGGACSGYLLRCGKTMLQLDLGCGTLPMLTGLMPPEKLDALLFTHWHHDHCSDLLPLLYRLEALGGQPLHVYGPVDDHSPVRQAAMASRAVILHDAHPGDTVTIGQAQVTFFAAVHPVPAVMFRICGDNKVLCYTGDTNRCPDLLPFADHADFLLADGLFPEAKWTEKLPHLSAALCAELARDAGVKRLVITHLHPAIPPEILLSEARTIRPDAELTRLGAVYDL